MQYKLKEKRANDVNARTKTIKSFRRPTSTKTSNMRCRTKCITTFLDSLRSKYVLLSSHTQCMYKHDTQHNQTKNHNFSPNIFF